MDDFKGKEQRDPFDRILDLSKNYSFLSYLKLSNQLHICVNSQRKGVYENFITITRFITKFFLYIPKCYKLCYKHIPVIYNKLCYILYYVEKNLITEFMLLLLLLYRVFFERKGGLKNG